jgi:putative transposase
MNPVAAGLCDDPASYPWSSCSSKVEEKHFEWLDFDPLYLAMGDTPEERRQRYRGFLAETVSDLEREIIQRAVKRGQLTGGSSFIDEVEAKLKRRIELRGQGRPRKPRK